MRAGRPKAELVLSNEERVQLESFARSRSLSAALNNRVRLVLASAGGESNEAIAARLKMTKQTIGKWRTRLIKQRIAGLYDDACLGPARTIDDDRVAHLIKTTLHTKPTNGSTYWSVRTVAGETGVCKIQRCQVLTAVGPQPHRSESIELSKTRPLSRSCATWWACCTCARRTTRLDEKSQCQAPERTCNSSRPTDPGSIRSSASFRWSGKAIRRGSLTSVKQLAQRIDHFVAAYNTNCHPFKWTNTADSILEKVHRPCLLISGAAH